MQLNNPIDRKSPAAASAESGQLELDVIGESTKFKEVLVSIRKLAMSSSITTLITGESGTGKEVVARLIHNLSTSSNQPFIDINCGAIPETLLESELFGYEKGAFTGANMRKKGLFELANGGTIFLDEIGNVSLNFQIKLLKAVENKRFRRLSGVEEVQISTRMIAATNIDLREAVRKGQFREDLYYRLNVCQICLPPLREREDDVVLLAQRFIDQFNQEYDRDVKGMAPSAIRLLRQYSWPGNVRQLKNAIERAVLVECDDLVEDKHLAIEPEAAPVVTEVPTEPSITIADLGQIQLPPEGIAFEELERTIILRALEQADGNVSKAARFLRLNRGKLRYRLERLGITSQNIHSLKAGALR
ncbi:sigma 54-interacting transcriptional regulator [bacterium]|nr:sigma 54-interacting transcriptional regulator [bacterium]